MRLFITFVFFISMPLKAFSEFTTHERFCRHLSGPFDLQSLKQLQIRTDLAEYIAMGDVLKIERDSSSAKKINVTIKINSIFKNKGNSLTVGQTIKYQENIPEQGCPYDPFNEWAVFLKKKNNNYIAVVVYKNKKPKELRENIPRAVERTIKLRKQKK